MPLRPLSYDIMTRMSNHALTKRAAGAICRVWMDFLAFCSVCLHCVQIHWHLCMFIHYNVNNTCMFTVVLKGFVRRSCRNIFNHRQTQRFSTHSPAEGEGWYDPLAVSFLIELELRGKSACRPIRDAAIGT